MTIVWNPIKWETPRWTIEWDGKNCTVSDNWSGWGPVPFERFRSIKAAFTKVAETSKVEPKPLRLFGRLKTLSNGRWRNVRGIVISLSKDRTKGDFWFLSIDVSGASTHARIKGLKAAKKAADELATALASHTYHPRHSGSPGHGV